MSHILTAQAKSLQYPLVAKNHMNDNKRMPATKAAAFFIYGGGATDRVLRSLKKSAGNCSCWQSKVFGPRHQAFQKSDLCGAHNQQGAHP